MEGQSKLNQKSDCSIKASCMQKFYNRNQLTCTFAYEFEGSLNEEIFKEAVQVYYNNDPIFSYNMPDNLLEPETFEFEKNNEEYQKKLDGVEKVVMKNDVRDIKKELHYYHNYSWENIQFEENQFVPAKVYVLKGYQDNKFTIVFTFNHVYMDGQSMNVFVNFTFEIYSLLLKKESIEDIEKQLQARTCLNDQEMIEKMKPKFWRSFINIIRVMRVKFGDIGQYKMDIKEGFQLFKEGYLKEKKEGNLSESYQKIGTFDFSGIFKLVRSKYPQLSKNSILNGFLGVFFDDYNQKIRYKQLDIQKEKLQGSNSFGYAMRHFTDQQFKEHSGIYSGFAVFNYDSKDQSLEDLSLAIHDYTQKLKKDNHGLTSQVMNGPVFTNSHRMGFILSLGFNTNYSCSNWTNFELQRNPFMLEGAEIVDFSQGFTIGQTLGSPDFPHSIITQPFILLNVGANDRVGISITYMDKETNESLWNHFKKFQEDYLQKSNEQLKGKQKQ